MKMRYPAIVALSVIMAGIGAAGAEEVSIWSSTSVQVTDGQPPVVTNEVRTNLDAPQPSMQTEFVPPPQGAPVAALFDAQVSAPEPEYRAFAGPEGVFAASPSNEAQAMITPPVSFSPQEGVVVDVEPFIQDLFTQIGSPMEFFPQPAPESPQDMPRQIVIYLNGLHETPPVDTRGIGLGTFILQGNELSFAVDVRDLASPITGAHVHRAPEGVAGPVVHPFEFSGNHAEGTWTLSDQEKQDLLAGLLYVNVHTMQYPNGEIRGQLLSY
jgi:hypothetical protein